jgi:hypothetical protein
MVDRQPPQEHIPDEAQRPAEPPPPFQPDPRLIGHMERSQHWPEDESADEHR